MKRKANPDPRRRRRSIGLGDALALEFDLTDAIRNVLTEAHVEILFPHLQRYVDGAEGLSDLLVGR